MRLLSKSVLNRSPLISPIQTAHIFDCLPSEMKRAAWLLPESTRNRLEEIRLRAGREVTVTVDGKEQILSRDGKLYISDDLSRGITCTAEHVLYTVEKAADGFVYSAEETIRQGFIPIRGGHRLGLCGHVVIHQNGIASMNGFSSLCIRIARDVQGISQAGKEVICSNSGLHNTLIISSPLVGKTTYLRDLIRTLSADGMRIGVCDERSEIAALMQGEPQFALGHFVDVIDGCSKAEAAMMLLRSMSPQLIAMDEITAPLDVEAICRAANCGVRILATAHADDIAELRHRKLYAQLLDNQLFSRVLHLERQGTERFCTAYALDAPETP